MEPARGEFTIVPVMVGNLSPNSEAKYGKIFAKYLLVFKKKKEFSKYNKILAPLQKPLITAAYCKDLSCNLKQENTSMILERRGGGLFQQIIYLNLLRVIH